VRTPRVRRADRWWDVLAVLFVLGGVALYFFARHALAALASGTYTVPNGVTYLSRTDLHVAETRLALWMVGTGIAVGILAAVRHHLRGRATG
jgi:uncharacterized membrane protein